MNKYYLTLAFISISYWAIGQDFNISAEIRPRFENRHGFGSPRDINENPDNFVSQRTRLNLGFSLDKLELGVSLQDVRVWGDVSTTSTSATGLAFQQAWALYRLNNKWAIRFGRQVIAYDDERIMGGVDWAQSGRSHDALLIEWRPNQNHSIDLGFAYNNDSEANIDTLYSNVAGYKTFQYGWYHGQFEKLEVSFLLLNTGVQYQSGIPIDNDLKLDYMQTFGPYLKYKTGSISADLSVYLQTGKEGGLTKNAYFLGGGVNHSINANFTFGLGGQYLSGKGQDDLSDENKSFNPIFGTNHKFNGWMDYFYVGNFNNSVGLIDLNASFSYTYKKFTAKLIPHYFQSDGNVLNMNGQKMDKYLGTELDALLVYRIANNVEIKGGYSQMFATNTMTDLKGGTTVDNHWAWIMITVKPTLFQTQSKKGSIE